MSDLSEWRRANNILAVRLDNIGDVLMLGPALRAIKETSPHAKITLLASPAGASMTPLLPWIDDVIVWRSVWQDVGGRMAFDPARERELIVMLAERGFDAAFVFTSFSQSPHPAAYVCYLAGIPLRAGESNEFGGSTLSTQLQGAPVEMHQVERNLRLVEHFGFVARDRSLRIMLPRENTVAVLLERVGIGADEPYILLHPGASAKARRYPADRFGMVAHMLMERDWHVLVTGIAREKELIETVQHRAHGVHVLMEQTTLAEYAALVKGATLVICNDTLPMHLADSTRTPEVVLFSGTDYEEQWRPRSTNAVLLRRSTPCSPCYLFECPIGLPCLDIEPEEVVASAEALLAKSGCGQ